MAAGSLSKGVVVIARFTLLPACQMGGGKTQCTELVKMAEMNEIEDGKVVIVGPDLNEIKEGGAAPLGICAAAARRSIPTARSMRRWQRASPRRVYRPRQCN